MQICLYLFDENNHSNNNNSSLIVFTMTIDEVKNELSHMEALVLKELTSFILQLRRSLEPERKEKLSKLVDSPKNEWISLDEIDSRLGKA